MIIQIGIAFSGATLRRARSTVLVSRSGDGGIPRSRSTVDDDGERFFHDKETLTIDSTDARVRRLGSPDTSDTGVTCLRVPRTAA
jgi:hypothetical protein